MNVRPATSADTPFLRRLHHEAYRDVVVRQFGSWDERAQDGWFEASLADAEFSVVEEDGKPIGAVGLKDAPNQVCLVELQILPDHQGRGFGSALLREQLDRARRLRKIVSLRVLIENRARSLYARHGFVVTTQTDTHFLMEWRADPVSTRVLAASRDADRPIDTRRGRHQ
jgi:GNAT superfamily N-acetyltransferase